MKQSVTQDSTKREYIQCSYSAMSGHTQSAQTWITQIYLQITPCLPSQIGCLPYFRRTPVCTLLQTTADGQLDRLTTETSWSWNHIHRSATRCSSTTPLQLKAKFHYAIWLEAGSKLVADMQRAEIWPII